MATYSIQALPGPNNSDSEAFGLNSNGEVAGDAFPEIGIEGVLWVGGTPVPNLLTPESQSILYSVNDAGDAVGIRGFGNTPTEIPILVRGGAPTDLDGALGVGAICTSINNSGVLCGSSVNNPNGFAYDTFANKLTLIPPPTATDHIYATAINQAGNVVGIVEHNDNTSSGFFYDGALHDLGSAAFVEGINDKRQVVGSIGVVSPGNFSPKIWDVASDPPAIKSVPLPTSDAFIGAHADGINNEGVVVGTCWTAASYDGDQTAYVYSNGSSTDLNTLISATGWRLQFAAHINDAGMITGTGSFNGQQTAFLLTPAHSWASVPELVATLLFGGVTFDGGGGGVIGGRRFPVGPWGPEFGWGLLSSAKRDALIGMALDEVAKYITDAKVRELVRSAMLEGVRTSVGQLSVGGGIQVEMAYRRPAVAQLNKGKSPKALRRFGIA
jgi:probable HAF family extracellular repeat protein